MWLTILGPTLLDTIPIIGDLGELEVRYVSPSSGVPPRVAIVREVQRLYVQGVDSAPDEEASSITILV